MLLINVYYSVLSLIFFSFYIRQNLRGVDLIMKMLTAP